MDLAAGLDRSEKIFQLRMIEIYKKYDHPFEDDIIVNIEDLTFKTSNGPRPWNFETKDSSAILDATFIGETSYNCLTENHGTMRLLKNKAEHSTDTICSTLIHSPVRKGVRSCNDSKGLKSYVDSSIANKTFLVSSFLETSPKSNKHCSLKDSGEFTKNFCHVDNVDPLHLKEIIFSDPQNKSLADVCPNMIECLSRLWNLALKKQASDNIVRYYRRNAWYTNRKILGIKRRKGTFSRAVSSKSMLCSAPSKEVTITNSQAYDSTFWQNKDSNKSVFLKCREVDKPKPTLLQGSLPLYTASPAIDKTFTCNSKGNRIVNPGKSFVGNVNNRTVSLNKPFMLNENSTGINPVKTTLCKDNNTTFSLDKTWVLNEGNSMSLDKTFTYNGDNMAVCSGKTFASQQQRKTGEEMFSRREYTKQIPKMIDTEKGRCCFSASPVLHSPHQSNFKSNCSLSNRTIPLDKTLTVKSQIKFEEVKSLYCKERMEWVSKKTCTLTRRNSFSTLPVVHSPGKFKKNDDFESLYRKLVEDGSSKPESHLSETVSSLVNSPGSLRVKRPASDDISLSILKRKKRASETFIISTSNSTFNVASNNSLFSKDNSCSPLPHTAVASALPSRMLPHSPVSSRSSPQRVNSECATICNSPQVAPRTISKVYKNLHYK
ncbi:uncharacterized protein LOC142138328 isoform X2 [Mixophyes fleayi]